MSGSPFSPDANYEYDAPHYVDFAQLPSDAALDAWFRLKADSSPTMVKAPVLFQLEAARASAACDDGADLHSVLSEVLDDDDLTVTTALAARFETASDVGNDDDGELDVDEGGQDADSESSFDSVATEVINFTAPPAPPTAATPSSLKTAQMLQRCDATQDELTLRIAALKSQILQLRSSVPPAPVVVPPVAPATAGQLSSSSAVPFSHTPRSAYLEAVSRVKKNIGLVADKESELHQLQLLQREMHLSKTPQEKQVRAPRHSSAHQRRQSTHTTAVRVPRADSAYMTPGRWTHQAADATGPVRLMATGPMRVIDPSQPPHHQHHYPAVTPRPAVAPGTVLKRQQSLLQTGALRIDTAAASLTAAAAAAAASESDSEDERAAHTARPSSAHRRRSHSRHSTPRRPHSHRTPRSPAMYDEEAAGESRAHRRHHTPRAADHETPRSTAHRARSHSRGHRRSEAAEPAVAAKADEKQHGERRRRHRSHSRGEHREHRHHRLRAESVPPTPAQASASAPATRLRSSTIETSSPARAHASVRRALDTERDFQALPRFMQPTESAAMRTTEQKRDNERRKLVVNARDHWEIAEPAPVRHTISQLDREAAQKALQLAALSPPPLPGPPSFAPPKPQLARGWSLAPPQPAAAAAAPQPPPPAQARPIARSESLSTAAAARAAKPVVRSSTMTLASARQPLRPMALGNKPPAPSAPKRDAHDRTLTTEERELLEIAKARRELHEHVMSRPVGMPKFVRRPVVTKPTN